MNILLCGASGFVGRHLEAALLADGHQVIRGVRHPKNANEIAIDYRRDVDSHTWLPRLKNIDVVINAIGVLRDSKAQPMANLHDTAPRALFAAAAQSGIRRIVQISALGVGHNIPTAYMQSKQAADDYLQTLNVDWAILRPSLIYGPDGASTRMFMLLAKSPVLMLPGAGKQVVQPVHIEDIAQAVCKLVSAPASSTHLRNVIECVGAEDTTLAGHISSYRTQQGKRTPLVLSTPNLLVEGMAWLGDRIPAMPLGHDTLEMLNSGSTGDGAAFTALLGHVPQSYRNFLKG